LIESKVASAPPIDFAMDIVEKEGEFVAKSGKLGGKKQIYRDWNTLDDMILHVIGFMRDKDYTSLIRVPLLRL